MAAAKGKSIVPVDTTIQPLSVLTPDMEGVTIAVRVLRKWDVYLPYSGDTPVEIEMVLVDKEGTKIMARIEQAHIYRHSPLLIEGSVSRISNFRLALAHGEFRPTHHKCKLVLRYNSVIQSIASTEVDVPPYEFTTPEECFDKQFNRSHLVDVVGLLTGNGKETEFVTNGRESTRLRIDLDNQGFRFSVVLFGEYTEEFGKFLESGGGPGAVIAVLFCKVTTWPGGTSIQTTQRSSKLLFNPDIPEAVVLRENSQVVTTTPLTIIKRTQSHSTEESFFSMDQKYTLADIRELIEFVATATINSVVEGIPWTYMACKLDSRKCIEEEDAPGLYFCKGCNKHIESVVRKLFLKLRVHDDTDCLSVVLFDNIVRMLIGKSAEDVYQTWKEDPGHGAYPCEVTGLIGKEAIWRIEAQTKDSDRFGRSYKAKDVSFSGDLLTRYKDKWASEATIEGKKDEVLLIEDTPSSGGVVAPKIGAGVTQDLIRKFDHSATASTSVTNSIETADLARDTEETPPAKRKVQVDATSSSKVPLKHIKIEKQA